MSARTPDEMAVEAPQYYPALLDLRGRDCLVVGGGAVARRKAAGLLAAGARVRVIAPRVAEMPDGVEIVTRHFQSADIAGMALVIAATDDPAVNAEIAREAASWQVWVNVVDDPGAGSLILPSVVRRGALQIAISTGGASPALARRLREQLEEEFGDEYARLVALLRRLRRDWEPRAIRAGVPPPARKAAWASVLDLPLLELLRAGNDEAAAAAAAAVLEKVLAGE